MKILFESDLAGSRKYGMTHRIYQFSEEFIRRGHEVMIVGASYSHVRRENPIVKDIITKENINGIEYRWIKSPKYQRNGLDRVIHMIIYNFRLWKNAKKIANEFKPDIVIAAGVYDNVLVIGADTFSKITDWTRRDAVFFGDGAGAAVFSHGNVNEGFTAFRLYTDGRGKFNYTIPAGGSEMPTSIETVTKRLHYFQMNGRAVYETGTMVLPKAIMQVLNDTGLTINDIDYLIPHQPSIQILQKTAEIIGLPWEKVMTNMDRYANTSGGTIPILLDEVNRSGKLKKGDNILFAAVGSGWTYGAAILKWS